MTNKRKPWFENQVFIELLGFEFHFPSQIHSTVGIANVSTKPLITVANENPKTLEISTIFAYLQFHGFRSRIIIECDAVQILMKPIRDRPFEGQKF